MFHVTVEWFGVPQKATNLPSTMRGAGSGVTPESPWKIINFQASLQGNKSHENWSQGHPKSWKIDPGIMRNPISAKVDFCNTSLAKCLVFQSQTPRFRPKNHQKKQPGNRYEKIMFSVQMYPKISLNGSPKSAKNRQNPSLDLTSAPQCPRIVPGSSQDRPRVPQDAKVEAPSMPNDTHGHHKPEICL